MICKSTSTMDAALEHRALGYKVFPLTPGLKRPDGPLVPHGVRDATADADKIKHWFTREPSANIGLACEGLIVIDCDLGNEWAGFQRLMEEATCPVQNTPSGGLHFVFRRPEGKSWGNSQSRLATKIDTRTDGGYITVEPSHTIDCPEENTVEGDYYFDRPMTSFDDLPYPPDWLVEELDAAFAPKTVCPSQPAISMPRRGTDVTKRAIAYLNECPAAISGQRGHDQTFAVTQSLVNGFCLEPDTVMRLLREHYNPGCEPPWSEKELQHKVDQAIEKPSNKPTGWLLGDTWQSDTDGTGPDISALVEKLTASTREADTATDDGQTGISLEVKPVDARFYISNEPPEIETIIPFLLDRGDKMFIIGPPKVRKSFFTLQMALSIAGGVDFLGWPIPQPKRVGLVQFEIKAEHFWRRVRRLARGLGIESDLLGDRLQILNMRGKPPRLDVMPDACDVLIYDPLYKIYAAVGADENAATEVGKVLGAVDGVVETQDVAAVLVHHDAKGRPGDRDSRDRGAGSGVLSRDYDCCLTLTPHKDHPEDAVVLETIQRNYKSPEPLVAIWCDDHFEVDNDLSPEVETTRSAMVRKQTGPPLEELVERAKRLVEVPMASSEFSEVLRKELGIGVNCAGKVISCLADQDGFARWKTRTFPSRTMVGRTHDMPCEVPSEDS